MESYKATYDMRKNLILTAVAHHYPDLNPGFHILIIARPVFLPLGYLAVF